MSETHNPNTEKSQIQKRFMRAFTVPRQYGNGLLVDAEETAALIPPGVDTFFRRSRTRFRNSVISVAPVEGGQKVTVNTELGYQYTYNGTLLKQAQDFTDHMTVKEMLKDSETNADGDILIPRKYEDAHVLISTCEE